MDVVAKLRQRGKKDQPQKLLSDIKMVLKCRYLYFIFFLKIPKIWVGQTTLNGEIKGDGYMDITNSVLAYCSLIYSY